MRFIRKNGRIIPIKDSSSKAAAVGAGVGAAAIGGLVAHDLTSFHSVKSGFRAFKGANQVAFDVMTRKGLFSNTLKLSGGKNYSVAQKLLGRTKQASKIVKSGFSKPMVLATAGIALGALYGAALGAQAGPIIAQKMKSKK